VSAAARRRRAPLAMAAAAAALTAALAARAQVAAPPPAAGVAKHMFRESDRAMGTEVTFVAWTDDEVRAHDAFVQAFAELKRIEVLMTDWERPGQPRSDVVRVNAAAGGPAVAVAPETIEVVEEALELSKRSGGAFDISYAAMRGIWKFDEEIDKKIPDKQTIEAKRKLINWRDIVVDRAAHTIRLRRAGMRIGLGGIAKGYAVDRCVAVLRKNGLVDFIVQAGGDLYAAGSKSGTPWGVGIQDPRGDHGDPFAQAPIADHAFSTAGDYERGFVLDGRRYHHIIDPHTGFPATASRSVTVFAPTALLADALDDAVFIIGPDKGLALAASFADVGVVIVDAHNKVWISPKLKPIVHIRHPPTDGV
jgi:thiamine biosynthesis lipoprotein